MYSSSVLIFALGQFFLPLAVRSQTLLEAVKCSAEFPAGTYHMSSIYAGQGRIYLFGGFTNGSYTSRIYLYTIGTDSLSTVGALLNPTQGSALAEDSQGNLLHFGGQAGPDGTLLNTINRFNTSSNLTELVGRLPKAMRTIGAVQVKEDRALVFGMYNDIVEVDLSTYEATQVRELTGISSGVAWDGGDRVLLLDRVGHLIYSISGNNATDFTSPEPHHFDLHHSVVSTPKSAWIVGNLGFAAGRGNGIYEIDFETLEFKFWEVDNYPAPSENGSFTSTATTYVPELNRLYMFGGHTGTSRHQIWYIDLPGGNEVTSTPLPPTPTFDCSNKPDGFYASPYACEQYFGCRGGETSEFECPPPFHFNPDLEVCDLLELVNCDLDCASKENGLYPHWHYCSFYLRCLEGRSQVLECPSPLLFDRVELKCNFPDLVNCTNSLNP